MVSVGIGWLIRADIEPSVNLEGVRADQLCVKLRSDALGDIRFPASGGSHNRNQFRMSHE
jgi:hypothetical protein